MISAARGEMARTTLVASCTTHSLVDMNLQMKTVAARGMIILVNLLYFNDRSSKMGQQNLPQPFKPIEQQVMMVLSAVGELHQM